MIGRRLGPWILRGEIGRGAMGTVYRAEDEQGRIAAVKVLSPELARDELFLSRFEREIAALRQLDHPHIVSYFDSGREAEFAYMAMEFVDGPNYEVRLQQRGRLPWSEVLMVGRQMTDALKHAHDRGVIHRDLKPANIIAKGDPDGPNGIQVKLTDFGVAKLFASTPLTAAGSFVGTAAYLAPENATGKPPTKRGDFYSLGCVLYALATGRPPFVGETTTAMLHQHRFAQVEQPIRLVPDLPHDLNGLILNLLDKDPQKRPADGSILLRTIDRIISKLERQGRVHETIVDRDADPTTLRPTRVFDGAQVGPGPATFAAGFVREELTRQNKGGWLNQLFNHPAVIVPLFLLCVAGIVYGIWRPHASDQTSQNDNTESATSNESPSEAQRFYFQGQRHFRAGDYDVAQRIWSNLVIVFDGIEREERWVQLARKAQKDIPDKTKTDRTSVMAALERACALESEGKHSEAKAILDALENLYRDDPNGNDVMELVKKQRQQ